MLSADMNRTQAIRFFKAITLIGVYGGLLMPLMFIPTVIFPFVFSKLIFFQVLVGMTFPAYLALAWMEPAYRPKKHILLFAIIAYFIAIGISVIFAVDPYRAWWGNQERMNGLFTVLHFLLWMIMTVGLLKTWDQWKKLLHYQIVLSAIMAIVAILQKINPNLLLFPAGDRVGGLLDNPIYMAAYQIFNFFFIALLFWRNPNRNWRITYGCILGLDIIAFILAQSRGALVGLAAGLVAFAFYTALFTTNKKMRYGVFGILLAMFAGYGALYLARDNAFVRTTPLDRFVNFEGSVSTRLIAWHIAWDGFVERPIAGWGFDNFHILFNLKYNPISLRYGQYETWFDRAHNTVLDVLSMTGLIGFLTYFGIYGAIFYSTWRAFKHKWIDLPIAAILFSLPVAYFVQNLFVFDHPAGFSMSYLLFALIIAATKGEFVGDREVMAEKHKEVGTIGAPWTGFVVVTVIMFFVVLRTSVQPFMISRLSLQANATFAANPAIAYQMALEASKTWTPYLDEQTFLISRNLICLSNSGGADRVPNWSEWYDLAKKLSLEEISRHARNTHPRFIFASLAQSIMPLKPTEAQVAEQMYLSAIDTSPKRQQLHYGLARLYLQTGNIDPAITIFKRVIDFDPDFGEGYWNLGITLMYDKHDLEGGAEQILKARSVQYPYSLQAPRELAVLMDAYLVKGDDTGLRTMIDKLATDYPAANAAIYAQLLYKLDVSKKTDLKDALMKVATAIDPATPTAYAAMLKQQSEPSTTTPQPKTATTTGGYKGPRR